MAARPRKEDQVKVNISLPDDVLMKAKVFAIEHRQTFSGLIEELLREKLNMPKDPGIE